MKITLFVFLRLFIRILLKQQHAQNAAKNAENRRFRASKITKFSSLPPTMIGATGKVKEVRSSYLNMSFFLHFAPISSINVGSVGLLCEKLKQYAVLSNKQLRGYRKKM